MCVIIRKEEVFYNIIGSEKSWLLSGACDRYNMADILKINTISRTQTKTKTPLPPKKTNNEIIMKQKLVTDGK